MKDINRVLIIGDAMIDTYIYGNVSRVSPEAPVPVVRPTRTMRCLGGAGNVARNAAALGASVSVVFVIGVDADGDTIVRELSEWGIDCKYIIQDEGQTTINKLRVVGNNQQIVRVDFSDQYVLNEELEGQIVTCLKKAVSENDIIVISDYGKGTCSDRICREIIKLAADKPVIVDPKGTAWDKYRGASVITPNLKEINTFSGRDIGNTSGDLESAYSGLNTELGIKYLLLTRSEEGMSLFGGNSVSHMPVFSHEVYDVSGAGDTVVAALATFLDYDMGNIEEAARISNVAAGLVVAKPGTAVVFKEEIQQQLDREHHASAIYTIEEYPELLRLIRLWKTSGYIIVTANGCFDIVHRGHIKLMKEAKKHGDKLIVMINSDASVKRLKGASRPINSELDRAYVMAAIDAVDAVVIFDPAVTPMELGVEELGRMSEKAKVSYHEAPMKLMKLIAPDVHIKGGDYRIEDLPEAIYAKELVIVPTEEGYSTTGTLEKVLESEG